MFFRYTRFLENQNQLLNEKVEKLEARNQELVVEMFKRTKILSAPEEKPTPKHAIRKGETRASCECGWVFNSEDPAELQNAITSHYRELSIQRGRKSWPQAKSALERASEEKQ